MLSINTVDCNTIMDKVDIIDFSDLVIRDAFNGSYLAKNKFKELAPRFPGLFVTSRGGILQHVFRM
jgi:hypothetical protein